MILPFSVEKIIVWTIVIVFLWLLLKGTFFPKPKPKKRVYKPRKRVKRKKATDSSIRPAKRVYRAESKPFAYLKDSNNMEAYISRDGRVIYKKKR